MSLLLQKLLSNLLYPQFQSLLLFLLSLLLRCFKYPKASTLALSVGIIWLSLFSLPYTAKQLLKTLEDIYPVVPMTALPEADAIVALGGSLSAAPVAYAYPNLHAAADRPVHAARLYHAGKAPLILIAAGAIPWDKLPVTEAEATTDLLMTLAVPENAIIQETRSSSTRENALHSWQLLGKLNISKIILVTSAWHMRRAQAAFEQVGFEVIPATTDYSALQVKPLSVTDWIPNTGALGQSTLAIKEWIGYWVYQYRGWI